jgi:glycosyltransferase involved in cell wall biosynthesis
VRIGVFAPLGQFIRPSLRRCWRRIVADAPEPLARQFSRLPSAPARARWAWDDARMLSFWLSWKFGRRRRLILHCRNTAMTNLAVRARGRFPNARVVYDCRGDRCAEFISRHGLDKREPRDWPDELRRQLAVREEEVRCAVQHADAVLCVSEALAAHLAAKHEVPREHFTVVPCCTDVEAFQRHIGSRQRIRERLGLDGRVVVTYCGSLEWYQLPEQALRVFRLIRRFEPRAHFLALTTHLERMRNAVSRAGVAADRVTVLQLRPSEVPEHLVASDVGLLLRDKSPVNRVAAPVKFAEYLASGTPVMITEGIGDYSAAVREHGLGGVVELDHSDDVLAAELQGLMAGEMSGAGLIRERCRSYATAHLAWQAHLHKTAAVYDRLLEDRGNNRLRGGRP